MIKAVADTFIRCGQKALNYNDDSKICKKEEK